LRKGYVIVTVDTEAQPPRQSEDHVNRLVYGSSEHGDYGIGHMMDVADKYSKKITFFVDIVAELVYPGKIRGVCNDIHARGHDVQLHAHPEFANDDFWDGLGVSKEGAMNRWDYEQSKKVLGWMMEECGDWDIPTPVAIRGGGYRYNSDTLLAAGELGITLDFNYNHLHRKIPLNEPTQPQPFNYGPLPVFRWDNGMFEVPVSSIRVSDDPAYHSSRRRFDEYFLRDFSEGLNGHIASYFEESKGTGVLVLLMHSWSFLEMNNESGYYEFAGTEKSDAFERFLRELPDDFEVITAAELSEIAGKGEIESVLEMSIGVASYDP
jgi:hypothetical protein